MLSGHLSYGDRASNYNLRTPCLISLFLELIRQQCQIQRPSNLTDSTKTLIARTRELCSTKCKKKSAIQSTKEGHIKSKWIISLSSVQSFFVLVFRIYSPKRLSKEVMKLNVLAPNLY